MLSVLSNHISLASLHPVYQSLGKMLIAMHKTEYHLFTQQSSIPVESKAEGPTSTNVGPFSFTIGTAAHIVGATARIVGATAHTIGGAPPQTSLSLSHRFRNSFGL